MVNGGKFLNWKKKTGVMGDLRRDKKAGNHHSYQWQRELFRDLLKGLLYFKEGPVEIVECKFVLGPGAKVLWSFFPALLSST